jgi:hypothetical protein
LATQFEVTPTEPEPGLRPVNAIADTDSGRRLDRLAPLLHELIAWDLVRQTDAGAFEIPEDVQERLRRLSALQNGSIAEVYVGRKCGRCGSMRVTRMVDGVRLCSTCSAEVSAPPIPDEPPAGEGRRGGRSRWHRKAG